MATCQTCQPQEVDPNLPINPNTEENYPDWYLESLQGLTYNTGANTDIVGTQVNTNTINPNTGVNFTPEEVTVYNAPVELGNPLDPNNPFYTNGEINWDAYYGTSGTSGGAGGAGTGESGVPAVPGYQTSPEQAAWEEQYGGQLGDWLEAGGYGIPEETKDQMKQELFDTLKANETENIRVMRNNMERRGITNSGFVYSNEQKIRATTTKSMAESIRNIEIQDAMMKLASWERAMGQTAQFLGYLSNESYLAYQPKLMEWQAKFDVYKMKLNQCYQQSNMKLQAQLTGQLQADQNAFAMEMAQMELEASQQQAKMTGLGNLFGGIFGFFLKLAFGGGLF